MVENTTRIKGCKYRIKQQQVVNDPHRIEHGEITEIDEIIYLKPKQNKEQYDISDTASG